MRLLVFNHHVNEPLLSIGEVECYSMSMVDVMQDTELTPSSPYLGVFPSSAQGGKQYSGRDTYP